MKVNFTPATCHNTPQTRTYKKKQQTDTFTCSNPAEPQAAPSFKGIFSFFKKEPVPPMKTKENELKKLGFSDSHIEDIMYYCKMKNNYFNQHLFNNVKKLATDKTFQPYESQYCRTFTRQRKPRQI